MDTKNENLTTNTTEEPNTENNYSKSSNARLPLKLILAMFLVLVLAGSGIYIYGSLVTNIPLIGEKSTEPTITQNINTPVKATKEIGEDGLVEFNNSDLSMQLKYPPEAELLVFNKDSTLESYEVRYIGPNQKSALNTIDDLQDGYIFRINVNKNSDSADINKAMLDIRNSYVIKCSDQSIISNINSSIISQVQGLEFKVSDCEADYIEILLRKDNEVYRITQIYTGGIDVEQSYLRNLQTIRENFIFTNTIKPTPIETWQTFDYQINSKYLMSFIYPSEMDDKCCDLAGPISDNAQNVVTLTFPNSISQSTNNFAGFSLYRDSTTLDFEKYIADQINKLELNYRIVTGKEPQKARTDLLVGGLSTVKFTDLAWWGDMYFIDIPDSNDIMLIIVTPQVNDGYQTTMKQIIESVKFELPN